MNLLFTQLKKARESKHLSVADIAGATNINPDFLKAIEDGRTDILPQTYIRAFLREYAAVVGLDPETVMRQYDEIRNPAPSRTPGGGGQQSGTTPPLPQPSADNAPPPHSQSANHTTIAIVAMVLVLAGIIYWNITRQGPSPNQDMKMPETQQALPPEKTGAPNAAPAIRSDSLILSSRTTDTVWVKIIVDSQQPLEYIMRPNTQRLWKAREKFSISLGNAGAIEFTLNNTSIGMLGKRGTIVRDSLITRNTLARLKARK